MADEGPSTEEHVISVPSGEGMVVCKCADSSERADLRRCCVKSLREYRTARCDDEDEAWIPSFALLTRFDCFTRGLYPAHAYSSGKALRNRSRTSVELRWFRKAGSRAISAHCEPYLSNPRFSASSSSGVNARRGRVLPLIKGSDRLSALMCRRCACGGTQTLDAASVFVLSCV